MRFRDKFGRLSSKLQRSRATSPAPSTSTQQPIIDSPSEETRPTAQSPRSLPEQLWNQAYDDLKRSETSKPIVEAYEEILSSKLQAASADADADITKIISSNHDERWKQMKQLVQAGLERTAKDAKNKEKVNQWLDMIKPLRQAIDTGIKAAPEAAVPWAGVCCALDILSSPLTEPKKNRDGMTHVLTRMEWYWELSRPLLGEDDPTESSRPLRVQLEKHIVSLYGVLLLYQMKSVVLYHRRRLSVFLRDLPKLDDWEAQLKEIKDAEAAIERDASQYNTLDMRSNISWQRQDRLEEKDNECLRDLHITNPQDDKETIVQGKGGLLEDSYQWVTENESYQQWLNDDESRLLWIKGDPGKGKTMLMAGIIDELEKSAPDSVVYFFCQAAEPRLRTASAVLRGLIWFLVRKRPNLISHVRKEYDQAGKDVFSDHNAWQALSGILTAMLEDETTQDCVFVIDALDECTKDKEQLISRVCDFSTNYKSKWIVSSRNWPEIEAQFEGVTNVRLQLELNHAAITNAVQKFIERKVEFLAKEKRYDQSTRDKVQKYLSLNANDTFLWVAIVCQELGKPKVRSHHTVRVLESFPQGLVSLYERMMTDVLQSMDEDICKAILAVVTVAFEPMTLAELSVSDEKLRVFEENLDTLSDIVNSCGSFLFIRENVVYSVHQSVNDFLVKAPGIFPSGISQQHYSLFVNMVATMQATLHRDIYGVNDTTLYTNEILASLATPLDSIRYSCIYWVDHLNKSTRSAIQSPSTFELLETFFKTKYLYWLESMSLLRFVSKAIQAIQKLKFDLVATAPKELEDTVEDALRFALTHRAILDTAPLQLYDSALIFSPALSKVRQNYENEMPTYVEVLPSSYQDWDNCLFTIPGFSDHRRALCFSPDGGRVAATQEDRKTIAILDTSTGEILKKLTEPELKIYPIAFSPDGRNLVTSSDHLVGREGIDQSVIKIWNTNTFDIVQSFKTYFEWSYYSSISQDGMWLALSQPEVVHIWSLRSGLRKLVLDPRQGKGWIAWIGFGSSVSGLPNLISIIPSSGPMKIVCQSLETGDVISRASFDIWPNWDLVSLDPSRNRLAFVDRDDTVWLWDTKIPTDLQEIFSDVPHNISDIAWTPDGLSLAIATNDGVMIWNLATRGKVLQISAGYDAKVYFGSKTNLATLEKGSLRIWRIGSNLDTLISDPKQPLRPIQRLTRGPNDELAVRRDDGDTEILSMRTGNKISLFKTHVSYFQLSGVFGPNHQYASVDKFGWINIVDTKTGNCLHKFQGCFEDIGEVAIEFEPSGNLISVNHRDGKIRIWDFKTGKCLRSFGPQDYLWMGRLWVTVSTNDRIAILTNDVVISIWDSRREEMIWTLRRPKSPINDLSFSSNGSLAVMSRRMGEQCRIDILNVDQDTCLGTFHLDYISRIKFDAYLQYRIDVGWGIIDLDLPDVGEYIKREESSGYGELGGKPVPAVWNQDFLRLDITKTEAWIMKGPKKMLLIPRAIAESVVVEFDKETGVTVVAVAVDSHPLLLHFFDSQFKQLE